MSDSTTPDTATPHATPHAAPYVAAKPLPAESAAALMARIPGWGADLDPKDRPSVPREKLGIPTGARWDFPERQPENRPRERSVEHAILPPVFGTSTPPRGLSGTIRRHAYKYSEARAAHWLLLIAADRVDAWEHHLRSLTTLHRDNPITHTGIFTDFARHGLRFRTGRRRADTGHQLIDPAAVGGPWFIAGLGVAAIVREIGSHRPSSRR